MSKKISVRDPQAIDDLKLYLALLVVLLIVRISLVRQVLKQMLTLLKAQRKADQPVVPMTVPDNPPEYWPMVYSREVGMPLDDLFAQVEPEEYIESQQVIGQPLTLTPAIDLHDPLALDHVGKSTRLL